ncbi:MAG: hypothetical protein QOI89_3412 [Solirubrobacteraceae bacterium]|nr:hypothetical protein [Solirubrobacteraceae bacterium]
MTARREGGLPWCQLESSLEGPTGAGTALPAADVGRSHFFIWAWSTPRAGTLFVMADTRTWPRGRGAARVLAEIAALESAWNEIRTWSSSS